MAQKRTLDLLPEIFRTDTNRKFLSATLDQLTQEPRVNRIKGFVGRRVGPGVNPDDNYVTEPTATRNDYQLEPGVISLKPGTQAIMDAITYPGMIDSLGIEDGITTRQDRLWQSEFYSWDPFCDFDKFVNYSQYYWLPEGPEAVDVSATLVPLTDDFIVTKQRLTYKISGFEENNPEITLVRGGNYRFIVDQPGAGFFIQATPGTSGRLPFSPNISSRDVLGVTNNGADVGTVTFDVPLRSAQDFYYQIPDVGPVDLICDLRFDQINNVFVDTFLQQNPQGIDGITDLDGRTLVFIISPNLEIGGWQVNSRFDPLIQEPGNNGQPGSFDSLPYADSFDIIDPDIQFSIWRIQYSEGPRPFMTLQSIAPVPRLSKFSVGFGTQYSNTQWYKNASGVIEQIPLLTAIQDVLYYQDSQDATSFGIIRLIDPDQSDPLDIESIIGSKTYISPNKVKFTNGLKVVFRGDVLPEYFRDREFYVEGVGTGPGITERVGFVDGQAYYGAWHFVDGRRVTGLPGTDSFQQYIYNTLEQSELNRGSGAPELAPLPSSGIPGAIAGNGIKLLPVENFITPEPYIREQDVYQDVDTSIPLTPDYITINRAAKNLNAWSRSNRWFHIDVITATAGYNNNQIPALDNNTRAKRPIIEFRANLSLYNSGTLAKIPVDVIDFLETDALSNIAGTEGYDEWDGYTFQQDSLVIFAADQDPQVRNKIYRVDFIDPDGAPGTPPVINLVPIDNGDAMINDMVVCVSGNTQKGETFWFDGTDWILAQQKTGVNQAPLFDVFDVNGRSFGDSIAYPSSTFKGSKLFGYAVGGSSISDEVLGFALEYFNINNIGDILFNNYFYTDTFVFIKDNIGQEQKISQGFARQYIDRVSFSDLVGWVPAAQESRSQQQFRFVYNGDPLILDVAIDQDSVYEPLQIFVNGQFVSPASYTVSVNTNNTVVTLSGSIPQGGTVEVQAISDEISRVAFYQVPLNLENNALNKNSPRLTLGSIRNHYEGLAQNLRNLQGTVIGQNNSRDLGNILPWGDIIIQQSSPVSLAGVFLGRKEYNIFDALAFNSQEYLKYKARLIDLAGRGDFVNFSPTEILDQVIDEMSLGKNERSPFYWSDMLPSNETYDENVYTVTPITTRVFDTLRVYDFESSNFQSLLVYQNGEILTRGYDYEVGVDSATVTLNTVLTVGDQIVIREYNTTFGSYVPNTPTKLGLYPAYRPEIYVDETAIPATLVIRGHDGSITRAYGDARDQVLLEFETRIFNNLKINTPVPLTFDEVIPGQFRDTGYSLAEINDLLSTDFLNYVGWNNLDYVTQDYKRDNQFTYNYTRSGNKLNNQPLLGAWRGIYQYFYDTTTPHTRPWEMLGFSQEPTWWESQYGPAPYTSGNLVLWEDLANGIVADPQDPRVLPRFQRPGLLETIPVDSEGRLLPPFQTVMGNFDDTSFRKSWTFGDGGPVESSWRASSAWPFTVMRLLALTRPAKFFSLFADRDRYRFNDSLQQWLWDGRYRLDANLMAPLYGDDVSKASYIDWIIDYNRQRGVDSTVNLSADLANIDVRLCWRLAGFSDKNFLKIYTEKSTPGSANTNFLLPDESYQLLLYKNKPFASSTYSSVVVQRVEDGWSVQGYDLNDPYFEILVSRTRGKTQTITVANTSVTVNIEYTDTVVRVPYGFVFTSRAAVSDFLLSYGELLARQGFVFNTQENGYIVDWQQMVSEFLYWTQQGWGVGSLINLNPAATKISITRPGAVANSLTPITARNMVLNQNRQPIDLNSFVINRFDNEFSINTTDSNTINFLTLDFVSYENIIVFDNASLFGDLIFEPTTGARQNRLLVSGILSADWNGTVNAPGFVINQDNIKEWRPNQIYTKGEIVLFKDEYWSASTIIQPSEIFDYSLWLKSDYQDIQKGLRPNAANDSNQLANSYSVYSANLEKEIDLFSYGLIGFRPRQYMQALNLDDVSQVNLYQQFLGSKGTLQSAEIFTLADLGKESAEYNVYEYWAILKGTYGATANRSYIELLMDQARLNSDPSIMQVIEPGQTSQADQTVFVDEIWKESYKITSPDIFPTLEAKNFDRALPTAGYVNIDDVDFTVFDINNITDSGLSVNDIDIGSTIWAAKINQHDWSVYVTEAIPAQVLRVSDNLNSRALVVFQGQHGLAVRDMLIIKYFSDEIDGLYRVRSVVNPTSLLIDYEFTGPQSAFTGLGVAMTLRSARVKQPSDITKLPFANSLDAGSRVWIDDDSDGKWAVLEKKAPFVANSNLNPTVVQSNSGYGEAVSQGFFNLTALIGAPGLDNKGAVYAFSRSPQGVYEPSGFIDLNTQDVSDFGSSIDIGNQSWAVIGAPGSANGQGYAAIIFNPTNSDIFEQRQLLICPDEDGSTLTRFGQSVTMSLDEQWIYISAPGLSKVYAYGRVDVQQQRKTYVTDGSTLTFNWSDYIKVNGARPDQLQVLLNNGILYGSSPNPDYQIVGGSVQLLDEDGDPYAPAEDQELILSRRSLVQLDRRLYYNVPQSSVTPLGGSGARFTVDVTRGVRSATVVSGGTGYSVGDVITIDSARIGGGVDNLEISVTQVGLEYSTLEDADSGDVILLMSDVSGLSPGQELQQIGGTGALAAGTEIINVNTETRRVLVDTPVVSSGSLIFLATPGPVTAISTVSGGIGIDDEDTFNVRDFLATADTINSFTVKVNNVIYRPEIDYTFDDITGELTFSTLPAPGATIIAESLTHFELVETLSIPGLQETDRFGHSVTCTADGRQVIIGAPGSDNGSGRSYVFDRNVQSITITDDSVTAYATATSMIAPTTVKINGHLILDSDTNIGGGYIKTGADSIDISSDISVGDIITIDTNQFSLLQDLESNQPESNANYGEVVDQCVNDCSLYVSSPGSNYTTRRGGLVEFLQNQSRVYGVTTSNNANPVIDPLPDSSVADIRINDVSVQFVVPDAWNSAQAYAADVIVKYNSSLFRSTRPVPVNTQITDPVWTPVAWTEALARDINTQTKNVTAQTTPDWIGYGDNATYVFFLGSSDYPMGDIYSSAQSYNTVVYVDNVLQTPGVDYTYNADTRSIIFQTPPPTSTIKVLSGRLIISVSDTSAADPLDLLTVLPGSGSLFDELGFDTYVWQQNIESPVLVQESGFGSSIFISDNYQTLVVGAPQGNTILFTTFDDGSTSFDGKITDFSDSSDISGAVYVYDFLPSSNASVSNPGQFVFGQQINRQLQSFSRFGAAIDLTTGVLLIGAPGTDIQGNQLTLGTVYQSRNLGNLPAWQMIRQQVPVVDVNLLNTIFIYDRVTNAAKQYLDFFDPLQGRLLGAVQQNLNYTGSVDPAAYNSGPVNNWGGNWGENHVGEIWLDTGNLRFIDPNQNDLVYASRRWGQLFPGSSANVYQWIASPVPPTGYLGPGQPRDARSFSVTSEVDSTGQFVTNYYFWVSGINTVYRSAGKTLSVTTIARYIENPRGSGIPYVAPLSSSAVAIYNSLEYISGFDSVIHIEFDQQITDDAVNVEYQLIAENREDGFLNDSLYNKFVDSLSGITATGAAVPDITLPPSELYGVQARPRQSMFVDRLLALENYLTRANTVLAQIPAAENRIFNLLNSREPEPTAVSGEWNMRLADTIELSYQDIDTVPLGYRYLVQNDSANEGLWAIYSVEAGDLPGSRRLELYRVQTYDTRQYWEFVDWYEPGYDPLSRIVRTVPNFAALAAISVPVGSSVKVQANPQNKFEIYVKTTDSWRRVALESGTIRFDARLWDYNLGRYGFDSEVFDARYFDQEPVVETRNIIRAINQEIFIDELAIERNRLLILMFNFILSEQIAPIWLTKTSLIDVDHVIRELLPFQIYRQDNQDFVLDYIKEVKPYHTQIREFNLKYRGNDQYLGNVTDFDVPALWDPVQNQFISPVLDNTGTLSVTSSTPSDSPIWQTFPYDQWFNNYRIEVESVDVIDGGSGYLVPPQVTVSGECLRPARMRATINTEGEVNAIIIDDRGEGYVTTALITIDAGGGTGARAVARMGNDLVRHITTTIKYDRYQYRSDITDWMSNVIYYNGDLVRFNDRVWRAESPDSGVVTGSQFDPDDWVLVPAADLSGINRTRGYYVPSNRQPGIDLAQIIAGLDYPGVQVYGREFLMTTELDAEYASDFVDPYLGVLPTSINVDGGAFVDTYSSHAPEELVPGSEFDTLDFRVISTPGYDASVGFGFGFPLAAISYVFDPLSPTYPYSQELEYAVEINVWNQTTGLQLAENINYSVDWFDRTVTVNSGAAAGDSLQIFTYELGGGNQLYRNRYLGSEFDTTILIPINRDLIFGVTAFVNGVQTNIRLVSSVTATETSVEFFSSFAPEDVIVITVFGGNTDDINYSWSVPLTQDFVSTGSYNFQLSNSLQGTNIPNIIINVNGSRVVPSQAVTYIAGGSGTTFALPRPSNYLNESVIQADVSVYLDQTLLPAGTAWVLDPDDGSSDRTITLTTPPPAGSKLLISVATGCPYRVVGTTLEFNPSRIAILPGDIVSVTTFNDTSQQSIQTAVWQGPIEITGPILVDRYDQGAPFGTVPFDEGLVSGDPGSYDFSAGSVVRVNRFDTGIDITDSQRLTVTLNGRYLFPEQEYTTDGSTVIISGPTLNNNDIVVITSYTMFEVPGSVGFRIFQDMRGLQLSYRILTETNTVLTQELLKTDDVIHVLNAVRMPVPDLAAGRFGVVTINGERITYRERNTSNNTLSGLRRGTAGTAAADHTLGSEVLDMSVGNLLPEQYQNVLVKQDFLANGVDTEFTAENISVSGLDSTELIEAVRVWVGGTEVAASPGTYSVQSSAPVSIVFVTPPDDGVEVTIGVVRGQNWYAPGSGTPSDGLPLQETNTVAARFIQGE